MILASAELFYREFPCSGLTSEPTHLHHPAHTQLAQDPLTGHTLVISAVSAAHTPLIGERHSTIYYLHKMLNVCQTVSINLVKMNKCEPWS